MLLAGFITPTSIHITHSYERNFLNELFKKLDKFIQENNIKNGNLISDRLYRRYVRFSEIQATEDVMKIVEKKFIGENVCDSQKYQIFFNTFYECAEEIKYLSEIGREYGRFQIGLVELPYSLEEKQLSNEYYDNLSIDAEPIWMRNGLLSA
jgi:uncharacterized membrane protein YheB (UPF0754 family)